VPTLSRFKKDPSAPKKPMSAFLAYSQAKRNEVKLEYPRLHNTKLSKILAEMWNSAPEDERNIYRKWEEEKRMVYKDHMDKWRREKKEALEAERMEREKAAMLIATSRSTIEETHNLQHLHTVTLREKASNMDSYYAASSINVSEHAQFELPETYAQPYDNAWSKSMSNQHHPSVQGKLSYVCKFSTFSQN